MLAGEVYENSPELSALWHEARRLMVEYNNVQSTDTVRQKALLGELLGSVGTGVHIAAPFFVDYGRNIHLGDHVEINMNCVFLDCNLITIGDWSGIGPGVHIYTVFHPVDPAERLPENGGLWRSQALPVTIGRNVWIGGGSILLPGVTIGDGTTVGAGSVVTSSLPAGCVAVGNPCRIIRML